MRPGPRNALCDVDGILVGHAQDDALKTGVTVVTSDAPMTVAVQVMGGAPGTRETRLLAPGSLVEDVDALVLSGGSAFGLAAADGVTEALRQAGRGFPVGPHRVPIVPTAILFDLGAGGAGWERSPYPGLGRRAFAAAGGSAEVGSVGAGTGASVAGLKGGLGMASAVLDTGCCVAALVAVNAVGAVTCGDGPHFWAAPFEIEAEFGGLGPAPAPAGATLLTKLQPGAATTLAILATDASLTRPQAERLAVAAHDGMARAIVPAHTPFDGDLAFSVSTRRGPAVSPRELLELGHAGAVCVSRAIARGVFAATPAPGDPLPTWAERFGAIGPS